VERCLPAATGRGRSVGTSWWGEAPEWLRHKPAPRNDLGTLRRIRPGNSPSRGSGTWHCLNRERAIDPRLGESRGVATRSRPSEQVIFGKIVRSFGSLAPPRFPPKLTRRLQIHQFRLDFRVHPFTGLAVAVAVGGNISRICPGEVTS
jgi:hypothetical protein